MVRCEHCDRQFVDYPTVKGDPYIVSREGAKVGFRAPICIDCAEGLDSNGMYQDEYSLEELERMEMLK